MTKNDKITIEQFKKDAETLTIRQLAEKYDSAPSTIYKQAQKLGIKLIKEKQGRKSKFDF
jgi:DNA-binding MurR/RpiR family transcriptional regulator